MLTIRNVLRAGTLAVLAALLNSSPARAQSADATYSVTYLELKPAATGAGVALAAGYEKTTRAEPGNLSALVLREVARPNRFVVLEGWRDTAAFDAHGKSAATLQFRQQLQTVQRSPFDQRVTHGLSMDPQARTPGPKTIYVVTHVDVPGPSREPAEALLKKLAAATRVDTGHLRFDVLQQVDPRTNHFTVVAIWDSQRAFDDYGSTQHALQFREALAPLLGALYDERIYRPLTTQH